MTMLAAALEYLDRGFSMIPVGPDKRPVIPWKRWTDSPPSRDQIHYWYDSEYPPGIAIITGKVSNLLVFDIEKHGIDVYNELPETLEARSQSGGRHLYFQWSEGPWKHSYVNDGTHVADLKGQGGYVLAPPTQGDKGVYSWVNQLPSVLPPSWMRRPDGKVRAPAGTVPPAVGPLFGSYASRSERLMAIARKVVMAGGGEDEVMAACLADSAGSKLTQKGAQWASSEVRRITQRAQELLPSRPVRLAFVEAMCHRDTAHGERIELKLKTSDGKVLRAGVTKMDTERWHAFRAALPYPDIGKAVWIELDGPRVSRWLKGPK